MTAQELLNIPDDGFRYELVRGELRKMSPAGRFQGKIAALMTASLWGHAEANRLGEVYTAESGFELARDPDHVRVPDVAFVRRDREESAGNQDGFFPGAPDVAIEVISPSDRYARVNEKVADYLDSGTLAVILIDPRSRNVRVHRPQAAAVTLTESDVLEVDDVIPGWRIPVGDIFRRL